jgi:hypothetical protein
MKIIIEINTETEEDQEVIDLFKKLVILLEEIYDKK